MEATMTPVLKPSTPQMIEEDQSQQYYYVQPQQIQPPSKEIDRNVMIMIFVAFIAGLLLGKIMNPVILKH